MSKDIVQVGPLFRGRTKEFKLLKQKLVVEFVSEKPDEISGVNRKEEGVSNGQKISEAVGVKRRSLTPKLIVSLVSGVIFGAAFFLFVIVSNDKDGSLAMSIGGYLNDIINRVAPMKVATSGLKVEKSTCSTIAQAMYPDSYSPVPCLEFTNTSSEIVHIKKVKVNNRTDKDCFVDLDKRLRMGDVHRQPMANIFGRALCGEVVKVDVETDDGTFTFGWK